ncbi:MAG TPA: hypothetical protein VNZ22_15640, partial [Bacillota bacterium]|nr:hypothetical protein [Bacillota bacterium]
MVVLALLGFGGLMLLPALARTQPNSKAIQCQNNLRQLTMAWQAWASDNNDLLLTCKEGVTRSGSTNPPYRVNWVTGWEDFSPANPSSWDPNQDL